MSILHTELTRQRHQALFKLVDEFAERAAGAGGWQVEGFAAGDEVGDFAFGGDDRAVVSTAEVHADFPVRGLCHPTRQEHGDRAGQGDGFSAGRGTQICGGHTERFTHDFFHVTDSHQSSAFFRHFAQDFPGNRERNSTTGQRKLALQLIDRALDLVVVPAAIPSADVAAEFMLWLRCLEQHRTLQT